MNCRDWIVEAIVGLPLLLTLATVPAEGQPSRAELLKNSSIVFVGTVEQVGAASIQGMAASAQSIVVRVEKVLEKPAAVSIASGAKVTVEVKDPSLFGQGVQATFYTNGWIFGDGIAVREVGHEIMPVAMAAEGLRQKADEIAQVHKELSDAELSARIQAAEVVVVGRVKTVRAGTMAAAGGAPVGFVTEHDPNWEEAIIQVESAIKGAEAGQEIVVRFPGSLDVAWYNVPKFKEGQEGTFILQKDQLSGTPRAMLGVAQVDAYTALSPQDVLSKEDASRVRALSKPQSEGRPPQ